MKRRNYTPNDNRNVIRMLAVSFAGSAKGHYHPDNGVRYFPGKDPFGRVKYDT